MQTLNRTIRYTLDADLDVRLRELVFILALSTESCLADPRVAALDLTHADAALDASHELCKLMKLLPSPVFVESPEKPASGPP
jgi:hypothetical protein